MKTAPLDPAASSRMMARIFAGAIPVFLLLGMGLYAFAGLAASMWWLPLVIMGLGISTAIVGMIVMIRHGNAKQQEALNRYRKPATSLTKKPAPVRAAAVHMAPQPAMPVHTSSGGGLSLIEVLLFMGIAMTVMIGALSMYTAASNSAQREDAERFAAYTGDPSAVTVVDTPQVAFSMAVSTPSVAYADMGLGRGLACSLDNAAPRAWLIRPTKSRSSTTGVSATDLDMTPALSTFCNKAREAV